MAGFREDATFNQDSGWREAEVLRLGAAGASRAEIAAALDLSLAGLAAAEAASPALAEALERAADRALAWWEAIPREALSAGVRFNFGPWEREMRRRFGRAAAAPEADDEADVADDDDDWVDDPKWGRMPRIRIPCNGRTKLRPDGSCPCSAYHNEAYWRADEEDDDEEPDARADEDDEASYPMSYRKPGLSSRLEDRVSEPEGRDLLCAGGDEQVPDSPLSRPSGMTTELETYRRTNNERQ